MMNPGHIDRSQQVGFVGGTLTGVFTNISVADVVVTVILSAIGALVSFLVSMMLRRIFNGRRRDRPPPDYDDENTTNGWGV